MLYGDEKTRAHHPDGLATEGPQDTVSTLGQGEATSPKIIIPETPEESKRNSSQDGFDLTVYAKDWPSHRGTAGFLLAL